MGQGGFGRGALDSDGRNAERSRGIKSQGKDRGRANDARGVIVSAPVMMVVVRRTVTPAAIRGQSGSGSAVARLRRARFDPSVEARRARRRDISGQDRRPKGERQPHGSPSY